MVTASHAKVPVYEQIAVKTPDLAAVKTLQQAACSSGDYVDQWASGE
jgi:hypothetical protein